MTLLDAFVLALVQGITEFLPISSSGHLVIVQDLLGISDPDLLFDIVLHVGTLLAVVVFYRDSLVAIVRDTLRGVATYRESGRARDIFEGEGARIALFVLVATIPTGIIGLGLKGIVDPETGPRIITAPVVLAILIGNGFILMTNRFIRERDAQSTASLTLWNFTLAGALLIGVIQGLAVMPGISRSGSTITTALLVGATRTQSARFSFLLSIPAILGALVLKFDADVFASYGASTIMLFLASALFAAVVGYLCLRLLVLVLQRAQFHHFAWYCWALGIGGLIAYSST